MSLYVYGFLIGLALILIFWFLIVAPMEKRMHERKMELMQRKLARNEKRLRNMNSVSQAENDDDKEETDYSDRREG